MSRSNQPSADSLDKYTSQVNDLLNHVPKDLDCVKTKKELAIYKKFVRLAKAAAKNSKSKQLQLLAMNRENDILKQAAKIEKRLYERDLKRHSSVTR